MQTSHPYFCSSVSTFVCLSMEYQTVMVHELPSGAKDKWVRKSLLLGIKKNSSSTNMASFFLFTEGNVLRTSRAAVHPPSVCDERMFYTAPPPKRWGHRYNNSLDSSPKNKQSVVFVSIQSNLGLSEFPCSWFGSVGTASSCLGCGGQ